MGSPDTVSDPGYHLILFDGVCNLCNGAVQFIIKRDHKKRFKFASLQSQVAQHHLSAFALNTPEVYSILLIKNGKLYDQSSAVLEISRDLSGAWPMFAAFKIIPRFLRDALYKL